MTQAGRSPLDAWIESELAASERRTLLVDGFNVIHTTLLAGARDSAWWGREARDRLLERVCAWPDSGDDIWVAFDGPQPAWSVVAIPARQASGGADISHEHAKGPSDGSSDSPSHGPSNCSEALPRRGPTVHSLFVESADDWIVRRARRAPSPERTLVVSADRKVAGRARSAGCEVWTPWAFVAQCRTPGDPGQESEASEVLDGGAGAAPCVPRPSPNVLS